MTLHPNRSSSDGGMALNLLEDSSMASSCSRSSAGRFPSSQSFQDWQYGSPERMPHQDPTPKHFACSEHKTNLHALSQQAKRRFKYKFMLKAIGHGCAFCRANSRHRILSVPLTRMRFPTMTGAAQQGYLIPERAPLSSLRSHSATTSNFLELTRRICSRPRSSSNTKRSPILASEDRILLESIHST